ncbi:MAG TPA: protein phosphatase 2C domain-containing protein, partial [Chloroflexota bacterium]|nr:protein phosphatase 2C domain-containing protein [Chloroflexota bacterium]
VIHFAKRCDIGARDRNEDSCIAFSSETGGHFTMMPFGLYIVADGMGGHTNGHVASKIASRQAANHILKEIYLPLLAHDTAPQVGIRDTLVEAVQVANTAVYEDEPEVDSGTTLTVALLLGSRLHVAHVGDSRLYLHTDEKLEAITNDHSLVQRLQDVGQLTAEEATVYRYRNVLLRAVGQGEEVEIDTYMRLLPKKGKLLLCSDGLCGFVSDDVIHGILKEDKPIQQMVDDLYNAAMDANSNDNVTVVLVEFSL